MKRGPLLIAICSCLVVAAIAAWPVLRISRALEEGRRESLASFSELRRTALNTVAQPTDVSSDAWRAEAGTAWRKQDRLLAVILKDSSGEVLYAKPSASPYYKRADDGLSFEQPEGTTTRLSGTLSSGIALEALYVTLSQEALFYAIRDAAVVFAALLAMLVAWLLILSNARPDSTVAEVTEADPVELERRAEDYEDWTPDIPQMILEESSLYSENPFEGGTTPGVTDPSANQDSVLDDNPVQDEAAENPGTLDTPKAAFIQQADLPEGTLDGPRGLFDDETGLGWEAYLRERLSSELRRSASFEQDLSLLITSFRDARRGDEEFNLFAATVRDFFSFKDMAFLFGEGGAACILPNMDVDHALRMSEELHKKLALMFRSQTANGSTDIHIGLSSRAGRLVDADRIIGEAMAALSKAKQDGGARIIAFRPDPEKFRAYLAGQ
jgi:GGDEF domain-containing protein